MKKDKKGLTLIELLAVIAIIAILFVLLIPMINSAIDKARIAGVQTDLRSYEISMRNLLMEQGVGRDIFTEENINRYLDEELHFNNGKSKKVGPLGLPYFIYIDDVIIKIYTQEEKLLSNRYGIYKTFAMADTILDDFDFSYIGFDNEVLAEPYCDAPISNDSGFEFKECYGEIMITDYKGTSKDVAIPKEIKGKDVTTIASSSDDPQSPSYLSSFSYKGLNSISLPNTIRYVGDNAFSQNNLVSVIIPESVVYMGDYAFYDNDLLSVSLPETLEYIGVASFSWNKIKNITLPDNMTSINEDLFKRNEISNVTLPNSIEYIGEEAFSFNKIEEITLPRKLNYLGDYAFYDNLIEDIEFNESLAVINDGTFSDNYIVDLIIPSSITNIGEKAFYYNEIVNLTLPSSLKSVGKKAFEHNIIDTAYIPSTIQSLFGNPLEYFKNREEHSADLPNFMYQ